jgi:hypothetical protein
VLAGLVNVVVLIQRTWVLVATMLLKVAVVVHPSLDAPGEPDGLLLDWWNLGYFQER